MATTRAKTLRLAADTKGLHFEMDLPQHHPHVRMLEEQVECGEVVGASFGFKAGPGNSRIEFRGNRPHRTLSGFKQILDVSPTWEPAYAQTEGTIEIRSMRRYSTAPILVPDDQGQLREYAHQRIADMLRAADLGLDALEETIRRAS